MRKLFNRICNKKINFTCSNDWVEVESNESDGVTLSDDSESHLANIKTLGYFHGLTLVDDSYQDGDGIVLTWNGTKKNIIKFFIDLNMSYCQSRLTLANMFTLCKLALR